MPGGAGAWSSARAVPAIANTAATIVKIVELGRNMGVILLDFRIAMRIELYPICLGACAAEVIRLQRRCHRLIGSIVRLT